MLSDRNEHYDLEIAQTVFEQVDRNLMAKSYIRDRKTQQKEWSPDDNRLVAMHGISFVDHCARAAARQYVSMHLWGLAKAGKITRVPTGARGRYLCKATDKFREI